ncbi:MAG TPA: nuclear transport factor 2 family protein [Nitrososphaerales archaeon]|nr:nuclear transport factor 2 family protein [Nitrososphaerales archaeon]
MKAARKPADEGMLRAFLDAFNRHDLDDIMSYFTEDCTFDMPKGSNPFGTRYQGKEGVREGLASRFSGIPDVHYGDDRHFVSESGDRGVSEWLLSGTATTGERIEVRGCDLFEFGEDGKIKVKDSYWKIVQPRS